MSQITLGGMDDEVKNRIRRIARQKGKSLNRAILDMINEYTGRKKKSEEPQSKSLQTLAGGWSRKRADEFFVTV